MTVTITAEIMDGFTCSAASAECLHGKKVRGKHADQDSSRTIAFAALPAASWRHAGGGPSPAQNLNTLPSALDFTTEAEPMEGDS